MTEKNRRTGFILIIAILALLVSVISLVISLSTRQYLGIEVSVEERNALTSPVFDEGAGSWSFVAIFELSIANEGMNDIRLERVAKAVEGAGFLAALKNGEVLNKTISHSAYVVEPRIEEIRANPRLLKSLKKNDMGKGTAMEVMIEPGATKLVRIGTTFNPYDAQGKKLADMVLLSFQLDFSSGKRRIFRRGVVIPPIPNSSRR